MKPASPYRLTLLVCLAEIFGLAPIAVFPALLPNFKSLWHLSHTEAGWISAAYYGGYMVSAPILAGLTDRVDARKMMSLGALFGILTAAAYAVWASGFWSAFWLRWIAGISLAGIYMPGLKVVSDHTEGAFQSRFVSFYTASFSIGASLSYLMAGEVNTVFGWRMAFGASALATVLALGMLIFLVPRAKIRDKHPGILLKDFMVVFRCRPAMAYILAYTAHMWELFSLRSWMVAFLVFSVQAQSPGAWILSPTQVAFWVNLIGLPASIGGNELARRFGRPKVVKVVMLTSALVGAWIGFTATMPYLLVVFLMTLYGVTVTADSASLTAGAVGSAPEGYRGTTLAVHSTLGFGAAFVSPLCIGWVLDFFGGDVTAWGIAFIVMAAGCAAGPFFIGRRTFQR